MRLVPNHLDAQLVASCSEYLKLGRSLDRLIVLPAGEDVGHARVTKVLQELETVEAHVINLRARSFQGLQAKALIAEWVRQGNLNVDDGASWDERIAWSIVRDLIQEA
jgi:hypothetical protein